MICRRSLLSLLFFTYTAKAQLLCTGQAVQPGIYLIVSVINDNRCLDKDSGNDEDIHFLTCNNSDWQKFEIGEPDSSKCYIVRPYNVRYRAMQREGSSTEVHAYTINIGTLNRWWILPAGTDRYKIRLSSYLIPSTETRCLDRRYGQDEEPQAVTCVGVDQQSFRLIKLGKLPSLKASPVATSKK